MIISLPTVAVPLNIHMPAAPTGPGAMPLMPPYGAQPQPPYDDDFQARFKPPSAPAFHPPTAQPQPQPPPSAEVSFEELQARLNNLRK